MPYGYHGRILHVDLTSGTTRVEQPDESFYRKYMGGSALGAYYVLKESPAHCDPLGPNNVLVLALSVVTGAPISGLSRVTTVAKSPLTGAIGDAQAGGFFPAELKYAGFDAIVIKGRAERPQYLWVHDGRAELRDAAHLWGKVTGDVQAAIRDELGDPKIEVAQCGPAGEKGVRFAAIINMCNRANGRTGMGAVMGSKNLKAVAVRGTNIPPIADRKTLTALARWGAQNIEHAGVALLAKYGTPGVVRRQQQSGGLPTRNYSSGVFEDFVTLSGEVMYDTILKEADTCHACVVRCKRVVEVSEGPYQVDPLYGGPEYETLAAFGSYCGVDDLAAVSKANQICNQYGMDTISCGGTIAWAMECFEKGIITAQDTNGIDMRFGNADAVVKMTEMIGRREGFGTLLAEGSARAAEIVGKGSEAFLITGKKQELPAHMPQAKRSLALMYAVNPFGADHQSHEHDGCYEIDVAYAANSERLAQLDLLDPQPARSLDPEKVRFVIYTQHTVSIADTLNLCQFVYGLTWQLYDIDQTIEMVRAVTGWNVNLFELQKVGERRVNLLRAFNARDGIDRDADELSAKLFNHALEGGPSDGLKLDRDQFEAARDTYYAMCGWDVSTGTPTRWKLEELGLAWVADMLGLTWQQ